MRSAACGVRRAAGGAGQDNISKFASSQSARRGAMSYVNRKPSIASRASEMRKRFCNNSPTYVRNFILTSLINP